jgi:iron complex outermembrane receptor protein
MSFRLNKLVLLMATTAMAGVATAALAQTAPAAPPTPSADTALGEVVVTATRQAATVDRVPLSITAVTQKAIDQQNVHNVADLSRITPGVSVSRSGSDGNNIQPAIRGIIASAGAATTGIYLDDTALQKFNGIGATVGNGSVLPPLFDLDRVEVLRGPQGTLYGGASEGGTIRFITPTPSLTTYSGYARFQTSVTENGDPSFEGGVAVGGPIIMDKLGFRASVFSQHLGGYLDHIDQYTQQTTLKNSNSEDVQSVRIALAAQLTPDLRVTPAFFASNDRSADTDPSWLNEPATVVPTRYWTAQGVETKAGASNVNYALPGYTYGPYNFYGPGKSGGNLPSPATARLMIPSFNIDYDLHFMSIKSITSYLQDQQIGVHNDQPSNNITALQNGVQMLYALPDENAAFHYDNQRHGISEEVRFSSGPDAKRLTWVGGIYYSHTNTHSYNYTTEDLETLSRVLRGVSATTIFGAPDLPGGQVTIRDQVINQDEIAAFGQATLAVTSKLKVTAGVRVSQDKLFYSQLNVGPVAGFDVATVANGGISSGNISETPVTPKFGIEYQLTSRDLLYVSATEGFREGGVNLSMPTNCAASLAALGSASTPTTYKSDTTWSYEAGAKLRLFDNRAQVNTSAFYIDWNGIQTSVGLPSLATGPSCIFNYTVNAAKAVSQGGDIQANFRLFDGLTANIDVAYTDAHYVGNVFAPALPGKTPGLLVGAGNTLPVSPWNVDLGLQYQTLLIGRYNGYLRGDYQFASAHHNGLGPGTTTYDPDTYNSPETRYVDARAGVTFDTWDLSLFVNNLTDSQDLLSWSSGGRTGCSNLVCTTATRNNPLFRGYYYRPREVGMTAAYRF